MPPELLQQGWKKYWSRRENRPYFFNRANGETLWEMPEMPGAGGFERNSDTLSINNPPLGKFGDQGIEQVQYKFYQRHCNCYKVKSTYNPNFGDGQLASLLNYNADQRMRLFVTIVTRRRRQTRGSECEE